MKTPEEQDPTWKLLLKSKPQQPSPAFVRNVVRETRNLEAPESGLAAIFTWFKRPVIAVPLAIGATAALFSALTLIQRTTSSPETSSTATSALASVDTQLPATPVTTLTQSTDIDPDITEDLERIDYLGDLVAVTDPSELDDAALADLFF